MAKRKRVISSLFENALDEGKSIAEQRKERKLFMNRKSYFRKEAKKKLGDKKSVAETIKAINEAQNQEELDVVKDFFRDMRIVRNKKTPEDLFEKTFLNIVNFLNIDDDSVAEEEVKKQEEEYWRRYYAIGSGSLARRIGGVYDNEGTLSALNLMDIIAGQGMVDI